MWRLSAETDIDAVCVESWTVCLMEDGHERINDWNVQRRTFHTDTSANFSAVSSTALLSPTASDVVVADDACSFFAAAAKLNVGLTVDWTDACAERGELGVVTGGDTDLAEGVPSSVTVAGGGPLVRACCELWRDIE